MRLYMLQGDGGDGRNRELSDYSPEIHSKGRQVRLLSHPLILTSTVFYLKYPSNSCLFSAYFPLIFLLLRDYFKCLRRIEKEKANEKFLLDKLKDNDHDLIEVMCMSV